MKYFWIAALFVAGSATAAERVIPPGPGKFYHGLFFDRSPPGSNDTNEHGVTASDVRRSEEALGARAAWVYFSHNWFESRLFPKETCQWIRELGKVPYIRLMLRSDADEDHAEKTFSLERIIAGNFDEDLGRWADEAKAFGSPLLIEWGTEPNGDWFSWNGKWNGGAEGGPERYKAAYRHIVDLMRAADVDNLQWVWHVNWLDQPETKWNRFENYFPGDDYCDWVAFSAYGPLTPRVKDGTESLRFKLKEAYPRMVAIASGKPIIIAEFGCDIHHPTVRASDWAKSALDDLFSGRWPAIIGFCWWNESWQNDDTPAHDTDMNVLHDRSLTDVFRSELARHADAVQQSPVLSER